MVGRVKYSNKFDFPDYVKEYLEFDEYDYDPNTYSATTLMKPARITVLERQNKEALETDYADIIPSRYGTAIHDSFEHVGISNSIQEKRVKTIFQDLIITGKFDMLKEVGNGWHKLVDLKSTSAWTIVYGSKNDDYIRQLSIYRWLCTLNGYRVSNKAEICFFFTDWNRASANKNPNYPQARVHILPLTLMSIEATEAYVEERIGVINAAFKELPRCTDKELWKKTPDDKPRRCAYCNCRNFCTQYKEMVGE